MADRTIKRLELAKTGNHGIDGTVLTKKDLQEAVETFEGKAPISIGHQMAKEDWFPSFGSVLTAELVEDPESEDATLIGDVEMSELLAEAYDDGLYTGWSISLPARASDGKRYIHHLAFLGAVPPKIKDLKVLEQLKKKDTIDMSESASGSTFTFVIEKDPDKEDRMAGKQKDPIEKKNDFSDDERSELERLRAKDRTGRRDRFLKAASKIVPKAHHAALGEFCDSISEAGEYDFSDGDGSVKKSPLDVLSEVFEKIPAASTILETELEFSDDLPGNEEVDCDKLAQSF